MSSTQRSLRERIEALPEIMRSALERAAASRLRITQLERQIATEEAESDTSSSGRSWSDYDWSESVKAIEARVEAARLKVDLTLAEDKAEIAHRLEAGKTTDSHIKALVGTDPDVVRLKKELIEAEGRQEMAKAEQRFGRMQQRNTEPSVDAKEPSLDVNTKLEKLYAQLDRAQGDLYAAEADIDVARMSLEAYKLLVAISHTES